MAGRQGLQRLIGKKFLHQGAETLVKLFSSATGFGQKEAALLHVFFEHFFFAVTELRRQMAVEISHRRHEQIAGHSQQLLAVSPE